MKKFLTWVIVVLFLAAIIAVTQMPSTNQTEDDKDKDVESYEDIASYVGSYQDEYSQRASADVELNDDKESLTMKVHWSDSAWSGVIWTMTLHLEDERLVYTDGLKEYYQFTDENEPETYTTMEENQSGYFEIKDGKLSWVGSPEDDCKECMFVIPDYTIGE